MSEMHPGSTYKYPQIGLNEPRACVPNSEYSNINLTLNTFNTLYSKLKKFNNLRSAGEVVGGKSRPGRFAKAVSDSAT